MGEAGQISNQSDLFSLVLLGLFGYQFYSFMHYNWIVENKISFNLMYNTCLYLNKQRRYDFSKCVLNSKREWDAIRCGHFFFKGVALL